MSLIHTPLYKIERHQAWLSSILFLTKALTSVQCFKLVAVTESQEGGEPRYVSIFDGETEYQRGVSVSDEVRAGHKGGIYVCKSVLDICKYAFLREHTATAGKSCKSDRGMVAFCTRQQR